MKKDLLIIENLFPMFLLNGEELGTGTGKSKKEAEQHAAQMALEKFKNHLQESSYKNRMPE